LQPIGGVVLRAETKTAALMIETAIFPIALQFTVKFWSIDWKWISYFKILNFLHIL
jgi:hypothetical protein